MYSPDGWVFKIDLLLGHGDPILGPSSDQKFTEMVCIFTIIWSTDNSIYFNLVYSLIQFLDTLV